MLAGGAVLEIASLAVPGSRAVMPMLERGAFQLGKATFSKMGQKSLLQQANKTSVVAFEKKIAGNGLNQLSLRKASTHSSLNLIPKNYFGSKTYAEMETLLTNKFGPPKGMGSFNKFFFNKKTERTFNLHWDPLHRGGRPHVDIRKRGLNSNYYKEHPFFLLEE